MFSYATLDDLRVYLGLTAAQTDDDGLLWRMLEAASRLIERYTGRRFFPERGVRHYTVYDPLVLVLDGDLLALHSLTNGDGTVLAESAMHLHPPGTVVSSIVLDHTQAVFFHDGDPVDAIALDGTWGYHLDWAAAWDACGDSVQDDPLSAEATVVNVIDADAPDLFGYGQRFSAGQLLRIEDEYLLVEAVDVETNVLTVARGVFGTAATSHVQATAVSIYQPPDDIIQACLRVSAWLYKQKDAGFVQIGGGLRGQVVVPPALPEDVQQILAPYVRLRVA